jgi:hypothetical protein
MVTVSALLASQSTQATAIWTHSGAALVATAADAALVVPPPSDEAWAHLGGSL